MMEAADGKSPAAARCARLYGVSVADPLTCSLVVGLLVVTSLIACGVPAWRASTTQQAAALRSD
jgi:hypothetical protein